MKMTIGKKIVAGFATVLVVTVALGAFCFVKVMLLESKTKALSDDALPGLENIGLIQEANAESRSFVYRHVLETEPAKIAAVEKQIQELREENDKALAAYEASISLSEDRQNFEKLKTLLQQYRSIRSKIIELSHNNQNAEAMKLISSDLDPAYAALNAHSDAMAQWNVDYGGKATQESKAAAASARWGVVTGAAIAIILGVAVAGYIIVSTKRALTILADTLGLGSSQVRAAAQQISSSGQSLAQGTSEQAASVEETSASIEEMNSTVKKNAEASQQAASKSTEAKNAAEQGMTAMEKMNIAIHEIENSAAETAKIIKVIDEIAFQTNLLALNAAVEAARAGEAGKGFAVVAEEVRNLAMRSAEAAKNTNQLIERSVNNAKNGVVIAQDVTKNLQQINKSVGDSTILIDTIASASREQSSGIDQISKSISQIEKVTQSTAANAEESAAASEELSAQSEQLASCVRDLQGLIGLVNQSNATANHVVADAPVTHSLKITASHENSAFAKAA